ncbi:hypothetical protein SAY86_006145 [Trapa natans]|uniref:Uncharacterized protein n=1 Tax=Trapa natans TaxID=22666 RepID=A0AAN7L359_TRANT|nr:hypothetical protein SAY86_006145 [Trapa natans]
MNTWEDFCQARLSPLNAQAIRGEGPVLGWPSDAQSLTCLLSTSSDHLTKNRGRCYCPTGPRRQGC